MKINYHARQELLLGEALGERIKSIKILVIGIGAAGNEILKNLTLMGFRQFTLVDFDIIENSNLSRTTLFQRSDVGKLKAEAAAKRLKELILHEDPVVNFVTGNIMTDLGKGAFMNHDIIICCVDTLVARAYIDDWCSIFRKPFFEVGFRGLSADITFTQVEDEHSPRLRDIIGYQYFDERRNSCSGLIATDTKLEYIPTIQSTSAVAGGLMATEIIKFIQGKSSLKGKILKYNGREHKIDIFKLIKNKDAAIDLFLDDAPIPVEFDNNITVSALLEYLNQEFDNFFIWKLPYTYLESWSCKVCQKKMLPQKWHRFIHEHEMNFEDCPKEATKEFCRGTGDLELITELHLESEEKYLERKLFEFCIPANDILTFQGVEQEVLVIKNIIIK